MNELSPFSTRDGEKLHKRKYKLFFSWIKTGWGEEKVEDHWSTIKGFYVIFLPFSYSFTFERTLTPHSLVMDAMKVMVKAEVDRDLSRLNLVYCYPPAAVAAGFNEELLKNIWTGFSPKNQRSCLGDNHDHDDDQWLAH